MDRRGGQGWRRHGEGTRSTLHEGFSGVLIPATVLWPQREPLYDLMLLRASIGKTAFESEKQNNPINPEASEWPESYFADIFFSKWPAKLDCKVMALDPSKGKDSKHGDYSAFVMLGIDAQSRLWADANLERRPTPQMIDDGITLFRLFSPQAWAVEINAYQELLSVEFQRAAALRRLTLPLYGLENMVKKEVRIRRLGPYLAQRRLKIRDTPGGRLLVQQMQAFPAGDHDDGADSLEMALRMLDYTLGQEVTGSGPTLLRA